MRLAPAFTLVIGAIYFTPNAAVVADDVENVGYTVVEVDVFCNNAAAFVALGTVPVTLAPTNELKPLPLPVNTPVLAVILAAVIVPLTPNDVNVPTEVMLG